MCAKMVHVHIFNFLYMYIPGNNMALSFMDTHHMSFVAKIQVAWGNVTLILYMYVYV